MKIVAAFWLSSIATIDFISSSITNASAFITNPNIYNAHHHKNWKQYQQRQLSSPPLKSSSTTSSFPDTSSFGGGSLMMERAKDAFQQFDREGDGGIDFDELDDLLTYLDIDATLEERMALFAYLDLNGDGSICLEEFLSWYSNAVEAATTRSQDFQSLLMSRRTVNSFDSMPVSDDVLRRAIECAIAAPNRSGSEPWRFIKIGPETVSKLQDLNKRVVMAGGDKVLNQQQQAPLLPEIWTEIPGWCVVTTKVSLDDPESQLKDFRSTSCAMQNFMLSMWSEGVGSKWTEGPTQKTQQFADIVGINTESENVVGIIWYGFSKSGGLGNADPKQERKKGVDDVLRMLP